MADRDLELKLRITADGKAAVSGLRQIDGALDGIGDSAENAEADVGGLLGVFGNVGTASVGLNQLAELLSKVGDAVGGVVDMTDAYRQLEARIADTLGSQEAANAAMGELVDLALSTHAPLQSTGELFARLARATKDTGLAQQDLLGFVESVNNAMRLNGTTAAEASGALLQLSQALASGALRGEEFNSVNEQMPALLDAVAKKLGVPRGELRELAKQGQITRDVLLESVLAMRDEWAEAAATLPVTWEQALGDVETAWTQHLGESAAVGKSLELISGGLVQVAQNLDTLVPLAATAGTALGAIKLARGLDLDLSRAATGARNLAASLPALVSGSSSAAAAALKLADGEKLAAAAALESARAKQTSAAAALAEAQAHLVDLKNLSVYGAQRAAAERAVTTAKHAHAQATAALAAAETRHSTAAAAALVATEKMGLGARAAAAGMRTLNTVMGALGGPAGVILTAVSALTAWSLTTRAAAAEADALVDSLNLVQGQLNDLSADRVFAEIQRVESAMRELREANEAGFWDVITGNTADRLRAQQQINDLQRLLNDLRARLRELKEESQQAAGGIQAVGEASDGTRQLFALLSAELSHLTRDELDAYIRKLVDLRAQNLITEQQFAALLNATQSLGQGVKKTAKSVDELGDALKKAATANDLLAQIDALGEALRRNQISGEQYAEGLTRVADRQRELNSATAESAPLTQQDAIAQRDAADARAENAEAQVEQNAGMGAGLELLKFMTGYVDELSKRLDGLSTASGQLFRTWLDATRGQELWSVQAIAQMSAAGDATAGVARQIDNLGDAIRQANIDLQFAAGEVSAWFKRVELQALVIEQAYLQQQQAAEATIAQLGELETASESVIRQAQGMVDGYNLLDQQTLGHLEREIDRLTRANEALEDSIERTLRRYQDLIDQQTGNEIAIAERERADAIRDLEEQIVEARRLGNAELIRQAEQALEAARRYHDEELRQLRERLAAEQAITDERQRQADVPPRGTDTTLPPTGEPAPGITSPDRLLPARIDPRDIADLGQHLFHAVASLAARPVELQADGLTLARVVTDQQTRIGALTR